MGDTALSGIDYSNYETAMAEAKERLAEAYGDDWVDKIDGELTTLDLSDEDLLNYFRLAYQMLLEEIYQEGDIIAGAYQIGDDNIDWLTVIPEVDSELHEFITTLLQDDDRLIAMYAGLSQGESAEEFVLNLLYPDSGSSFEDFEGFTDDARDLDSIFDLGSGYGSIIEMEDLYDYYLESVMTQIADLDEQMMELYDQLLSGDITDLEYDNLSNDLSSTKEFLYAAAQQLMSDKMYVFQALSEILQKMLEGESGIIDKWQF